MTRLELENEILQLVNDAEDIPYTDIQGIAMALAMRAIPNED